MKLFDLAIGAEIYQFSMTVENGEITNSRIVGVKLKYNPGDIPLAFIEERNKNVS